MTDLLSQEKAQENTLPDTWIQASFGDLAEYLNGRAFKKSEWHSTGKPIIRIQNLTGSSPTLNRFSGEVEDRYIVRDGDLLISWSATLGAYIYRGEEAVLNQHIFKVEPYIDKRFLYYLTYAYIDELRRQAHGSGMQHITKGKFEASEVPLPPLNEQRRIVKKIEELFTKLDAGVRSLEQVREQLKSYRRSVLKAAVEGELSREWREARRNELEPASELLERILQERREKFAGKKYKEPASPDTSGLPELPEGWEWSNLEQLAWDSGYGTSTKCSYDFAGPPVLRIPNVNQANISFEDVKFADQTASLKDDAKLDAGDLLIIRTNGSRDLIGRSAVVRQELEQDYYFASYLIRYRLLGSDRIFAWLATIWHAQPIRSWMIRTAATSAGQYNISVSALNNLAIPLPPQEEAKYIAEEVERRLSIVDKLEATVEENLKQAAGLRQSILKQAFSGELVPQDPNDEPASVLLEQIREEREAAKQKTGKGRKRKTAPAKSSHAEQGGLF